VSDLLELAKSLLQNQPKVDEILARPEVKQEVERPRQIDRTHDVPYLAGSSKDGGTTFVDKRIPPTIKVNDKVVDPAKYLNVHEQTEHALMTIGKMPYHKAHAVATEKEKEAVEKDGVDWKEYEKVMDGYIDETEHENAKNPPKQLYLKPYPHGKKHSLQEAEAKEPVKEPSVLAAALLSKK
jgi:hypothetical protein